MYSNSESQYIERKKYQVGSCSYYTDGTLDDPPGIMWTAYGNKKNNSCTLIETS
jgi:hypothetical protein